MFQTTYLIIGASRGIGHEIVKQLSQDAAVHIIATTRKPVDFGQPNVENIILDQTDSKSVEAAAAKVKSVDVLLVNAAIGDLEFLLLTSTERLHQYLDTNVVGVHRVVNDFLPALRAGKDKKIIIMSSSSGSNGKQKDPHFGL